MNRVSRLVTVHGQVQGVFFRDGCRREAEHYGVTGWIENAPDGTVRALFEGPSDAVETLLKWAHDGPTRAVVDRVDVTGTEDQGTSEFRVRG
ncbi:MAG TPA: acylphosphatase [Nocardioidaceae bacterium]|jgi:acylphosphatase|nr:acylphosphatase [Nocardioidaceae bacterium]